MANTMDLMEAHMWRGQTFGPGAGVTLPDDEKAVARIKTVEEAARKRAEAQLREQLSVLPSGHPYFQLLGVQGSQPEQFEGTPTPVGQVADALVSPIEQEQIDNMEGELGDGLDPTGQPNQATLAEATLATRTVAGAAPSGQPQGNGGGEQSGPRRASRGSTGTPPPAASSE